MHFSKFGYNKAKFDIHTDCLNPEISNEYMKVCFIVNGKGFFHVFKFFQGFWYILLRCKNHDILYVPRGLFFHHM